jgi:hypothetical protein
MLFVLLVWDVDGTFVEQQHGVFDSPTVDGIRSDSLTRRHFPVTHTTDDIEKAGFHSTSPVF